MPTQLASQDDNTSDIKVKTAYNGEVMITYIKTNVSLQDLIQEMIAICRFKPDQLFTMKWVDEEGDPCTISTQLELDEAIRLYEINRDSELTIHECAPSNIFLHDMNNVSSSISSVIISNKSAYSSSALLTT